MPFESLAPVSGAANSADITVSNHPVRVSWRTTGGTAVSAGTADLERKQNDGNYIAEVGGTVQLSATQTSIVIDAPGTYRMAKSSTTPAAGIEQEAYPNN